MRVQAHEILETAGDQPQLQVRRIQPSVGLLHIDWPELWRYHELLFFLMWRDLKARYRQTVLGSFWAIFRPFVSMVIFTLIFNRLAGITAGGNLPYALFVFPGILMWNYFSSALNGGSASISGNAALVTKAYFPRAHLVLSAIVAPLVDFALGLVIVLAMFAYYRRLPSWHIVLLPAFLALALLVSLGLSLWLAPLTVRYRDVPFMLPFALQIWMYITPVIYPVSFVPARFHWLLALNPISGVVTGTRWSLVGGAAPTGTLVASSLLIGVALVLSGLVYFRRREPTFPDFI
jgi:homopolymeric O-antigen transport system permease protein